MNKKYYSLPPWERPPHPTASPGAFKQDPKVRLKTLLNKAIEALEDIGPYGTQITMADVMKRAQDAVEELRKDLAEYRREFE